MRLGLPRRLGDRLLVAGGIILLLVLAASLGLVLSVRSLQHSADLARHSNAVLEAAQRSEKLVLDVETGARGYIITHDPAFLQPWDAGRRDLPSAGRTLVVLVRDNPAQEARARRAARQISEYIARYSVPVVALARRSPRAASSLVRSAAGKRRVDAIRATFAGLFAEERRLANRREASARHRAHFAYAVIGASGVFAVLVLLVLVLSTRRRVARPLGLVEDAARRMAAGDLSARSGVSGRDEVGMTGAAFDTMAAALQAEQETVRRANRELTRSNAELEQFAYVASHDLSEPLRVVAGFTDLLARRSADTLTEDTRGYVDRILAGTERMQQLIDDLLRYSRVGRAELDLRVLELDRVVGEALARLEVARQEAHAEVEVSPLPEVCGDERQLAVVFQNLLANAFKFRRPGEETHHVRVTGQSEGETAVIRVEDSGIGIAPEHRERIFRMFQRLHTRTEYSGTGIGLALCQRIMDRHGGEISVESSELGGAAFLLRIPTGLKTDGPRADHPERA